MGNLESLGLLLSLLGALLVAYALLSSRSSYQLQQDLDANAGSALRKLVVSLRYDIAAAFGFISAGFGLQFLGGFGGVNPAFSAFGVLAGIFLYMLFLSERELLTQKALDDYEGRKNSPRRKK